MWLLESTHVCNASAMHIFYFILKQKAKAHITYCKKICMDFSGGIGLTNQVGFFHLGIEETPGMEILNLYSLIENEDS